MSKKRWEPSDNPKWCIEKLLEIAKTKCADFGAGDPFCGKCDSCFAGRALAGLVVEWYKERDAKKDETR